MVENDVKNQTQTLCGSACCHRRREREREREHPEGNVGIFFQASASLGQLDSIIDTIKTCAGDMKLLRQVDKALKDDFAVYRIQQIDLLNFFKCTNSPESISDLEKHVQTMQHHEQDYGRALSNIATLKCEVIETMSHFSGSSLKSRHSSRGTSVIALKCAKADAARAQVAFTEKEALILKQKAFLAEQERMQATSTSRKTAELEADLRVLSKHREAAAAEAEANALKFANEDRGFPLDEFGKDQHVDSAERTRAYVVEQSQYVHNEKVEPIATGKAGLYAQDNLMNKIKTRSLPRVLWEIGWHHCPSGHPARGCQIISP